MPRQRTSKYGKDAVDVASQLADITSKVDVCINLKKPPTPLVGAKGDGTDDATRIQTLLTAVSTTYTRATVIIPYAIYKLNSGITIPNNIDILGISKPVLDFSGAPSSVKAITINGQKQIIENISLKGNGYSGTTSIGLDVTGAHLKFRDIDIDNFNTGIDFAHSQTYIITFQNIFIQNTSLNMYGNFDVRSAVNAGERITFTDCTLSNSAMIGDLAGGSIDIYFKGCSIDYCNEFFTFGRGYFFFESCHWENSLTASARTWRATVDRFFTCTDNAYVYLSNCEMLLFDMHKIVNETSTLGHIKYTNCKAWFLAMDGTSKHALSESHDFIAAGTTTYSLYSPFVSKNVYPSAMMAANYNNKQVANISPELVMDMANYKITFNFPTAPASNTYVKAVF